ncbi:MAG: lytic transglycosylase domain-containing protein, partial [Flavobacteriaceae bacterium]|nr:lytic transglycosylase domain-containing protein [Flavobacteriaceae bacterium]
MQKTLRFLSISSIILLSFSFFNALHVSDAGPKKNTADTYIIKALKIPPGITFAGEKVPIDRFDIKERMDRELLVNTYWQSNGLLMIKRANKYFPIIEPLL